LSAAHACFAARSDVICDFPLREMLAFHKKAGAEGTILVTQARCPSPPLPLYCPVF
jgi:mannose-1-phosphate guanylyltransferase